MISTKHIQVLDDHRISVRFSDGTAGIADMRECMASEPFRSLNDREVFKSAFIDHGVVEWPSGVGIATEALYALAHGLNHPTTLKEALHNEFTVSLRELRKAADMTQIEAAEAMRVDQSQLSRLERQEDAKLSTLRAYVEALCGRLEIFAELNGKRMKLAV
jgi:hypothetical protein